MCLAARIAFASSVERERRLCCFEASPPPVGPENREQRKPDTPELGDWGAVARTGESMIAKASQFIERAQKALLTTPSKSELDRPAKPTENEQEGVKQELTDEELKQQENHRLLAGFAKVINPSVQLTGRETNEQITGLILADLQVISGSRGRGTLASRTALGLKEGNLVVADYGAGFFSAGRINILVSNWAGLLERDPRSALGAIVGLDLRRTGSTSGAEAKRLAAGAAEVLATRPAQGTTPTTGT